MFKIKGIQLACISCCVPDRYEFNRDLSEFEEERKQKIIQSTGVVSRPVVNDTQCTSDLVCQSAENLIKQISIDPDKIGVLILVTQTPDYILPATSCIIHNRLKLCKDTIVFDINLGCSGYIYGLYVASILLMSSDKPYALLLAGDTISKYAGKEDASTRFIFGDAGSATLLGKNEQANTLFFSFGTDGSGWQNLIIPAGGARNRDNKENNKITIDSDGNKRTAENLYMDGMEIFNFTISTVVPHLQEIIDKCGFPDTVVFHQANRYMLEFMRKSLKIPKDRFLYSLEKYGNTSSASIPLTLCSELKKTDDVNKTLLSGFGVGYSWGSVMLNLQNTLLLNIYEYSGKDE